MYDSVMTIFSLTSGADQAIPSPQDGVTCLMYACCSGHTDVVAVLLEGGADPNVMSPAGTNALMGAVTKGHAEVVRLLLQAGAQVDAADPVSN